MRAQAKRCTQKELAYLSHWRRNDYMLTIDDEIPLSTLTPPVQRELHWLRRWLLGLVIICVTLGLFGLWFVKAAGVM
jgi:hypothetical protein